MEERSRGDYSKEVAVVVRPQDFFELEGGPWLNPAVDKGVVEERLVAGHQDPITIGSPSLLHTRIFDPHRPLA